MTNEYGKNKVESDCSDDEITSQRKLNDPKKIHPEHTKSYLCQFCDKSFVIKSNLKRHEKSLHLGDRMKTFKCVAAGCSFRGRDRYQLREGNDIVFLLK